MNASIFEDATILCDMCGTTVAIEEFPAHCILCRSVARQTPGFFTTQSVFMNILFDTYPDPDLQAREDEMLNHKIVKRLKNIDSAAPAIQPTGDNCCICLDPMSDEARKTLCGHEFCSACIEKWFLENTTCPICKNDFSETADYDLIDTQTNLPINNRPEEPTASNLTIRSIIRRLDIIGSILDEIQN